MSWPERIVDTYHCTLHMKQKRIKLVLVCVRKENKITIVYTSAAMVVDKYFYVDWFIFYV